MKTCASFYDGTKEKEDLIIDLATQTQDGLMSKEDKTKLDELTGTGGGTIDSIDASKVVQDSTHKFVTDVQISTWDAKASTDKATTEKDGLMSKEDKTKLDAIEAGANNYTHPENHDASMITQDATHRFVTDEEKTTWNKTVDKDTIGLGNVTNDAQVKRSEMGVASGVATLDESGKVPSAQLPSFVDDVVEVENYAALPPEGESSKIYVDKETNKTYRWSGSGYVAIGGEGVSLGETSSTAYAGDKGKAVTDEVNKIKEGTTIVPKATDATTVSGHTVEINVPSDAKFTDTTYEKAEAGTKDGLMSKEDKTKLDGIAANANNYVHPDDTNTKHVSEEEKAKWNAKAEATVATGEANGLMSSTDKTKLDGIEAQANKYVHPANHEATVITEDATHRFVTDEEKSTWNAKASTDKAEAGSKDGLMSKEDKAKLDGIAANANNYEHPANHDASIITETSEKKFVSDAEKAKWNAKAENTVASGEANGLMSSTDKTKLDGIDPKKIPNSAKLEGNTIQFSNTAEPDTVLFSVDLTSVLP